MPKGRRCDRRDADGDHGPAADPREVEPGDAGEAEGGDHAGAELGGAPERGGDGHVVVIGSGGAGLGLYLAEAGAGEVVGVTLSKEQLKVSRERARRAGKSRAAAADSSELRQRLAATQSDLARLRAENARLRQTAAGAGRPRRLRHRPAGVVTRRRGNESCRNRRGGA